MKDSCRFFFYGHSVPRDEHYLLQRSCEPVPVAAPSTVWVCGRSLAGLRAPVPPGAWSSVCCECCVLSGRGLRRSDPSSRGFLSTVVYMSECDSKASTMRRPWSTRDCPAIRAISSMSQYLSAFDPIPKFSYPYWPKSAFPLL